MTAANLGARLTGWGFVVFTIGSIAWTMVGVSSGQANLIAANGFLTLVNIVGVWRWLGREARYRDDAVQVEKASARAPTPTLTALSDLTDMPVEDRGGSVIGAVVDAMIAREDGRLSALLVRHGGVGGVGERVVLLDATDCTITAGKIVIRLSASDIASLPEARDAH